MSEAQRLREVYASYLAGVRGDAWVPVSRREVEYHRELLGRAETIQDLAGLVSVPAWFRGNGFKGVRPISASSDPVVAFQFDQTPTGWYGVFAQTPEFALTYGLFRSTLAPSTGPETSVMCVTGGLFHKTTARWYPFRTLFSGKGAYSVSGETVSVRVDASTFLTVDGDAGSVEGRVDIPSFGVFSFRVVSRAAAVLNGKGGCVPVCFGGVGSSYWSWTNMEATLCPGQLEQDSCSAVGAESGIGWFDHQWITSGVPRTWLTRFLFGTLSVGKRVTPLKWIWFAIQQTDAASMKTSAEQYAGSVTLTDAQAASMRVGTRLNASVNHYTKAGVRLNVPARVVVREMVGAYPTRFEIVVGNRRLVLGRIPGSRSEVVLPNGTTNWEGPAYAFEGSRQWGTGFIECNNMLPGNTALASQIPHLLGQDGAIRLFRLESGLCVVPWAALGALVVGLVAWGIVAAVRRRRAGSASNAA